MSSSLVKVIAGSDVTKSEYFSTEEEKMLSKECFHETIERHAFFIESPYAKEFAFGEVPNHKEVNDLIVRFSFIQGAFEMRIFEVGPSHADRETIHCLHQLGRSYGSRNKSIREGARAALRAISSNGSLEVPAVRNLWWQLAEGIRRYNTAHRARAGFTPCSSEFFERSLHLASRYGDCFLETKRRSVVITGFTAEDWRHGAKMALDAIYLFWNGLEKRRKKLR